VHVKFITDGKSNGDLPVCHEVQCLHNHPSRYIDMASATTMQQKLGAFQASYSNTEEVVFGFESFNAFVSFLKNVTARLTLPINIGRYNCINRDRRLNP